MNMKTKLATILLFVLLFSACGNNQRNSIISSSEEEKEAITESQSSSTHMTGEVPGRPGFFEDIGKPYSVLMNEHPTATIVSEHAGIPDAALVCLQVPGYDFAYILFGTQYLAWEHIAESERNKLTCSGIAATVDLLFPGIGEVIALDDFFTAIRVSDYAYFSEIGPGQGWIEFAFLNRTVFIDTGRDSRLPNDNFQPVKTIKNSYPAVIMDFGIASQNQMILNDVEEWYVSPIN